MNSKASVAHRLKLIRKEAGVSLRELARRLGKSPSSYNHYELSDKFKDEYLPMSLAQEIATALKPEGVADQILALAGASGPPPTRVENDEEVGSGVTLVPVFDVQASAGFGSVAEYEPQTHSLAFPPSYLKKLTSGNPENLAIISVKGDSMEPTILDGDIVLLDASKTNLSYDGLFVLRYNDALHVKRVGRSAKKDHVNILSDNRAIYPPTETHMGEVHAVGKVLWFGRKV